ncbi:hypothetical protein SGLAD_v1c07950 [Spiroplasma gladiatoris]|uniref:Serine aminopeptidase S33 domain-containing protein n=1 Tax=Spiroplasma gladiatoris TaxID=2143 RepID=A0A4P7AHS5_9MOLU|nr:alpha/beta fold hydrolase [Spiroplasma gladiatoris]QBQ07994.1 hypothetical protein SGLAD_v1c07950 [Spiroplasma gladiatoris]
MIWKPLLELITPIFYIIGATTIFFILLYFINRYVKMSSLKFKSQAKQRGNFVNLNSFTTKDGYSLKIEGFIKKENEKLIVCVHDFKSSNKEFSNLINYFKLNKIQTDIIAFDQRGCNKNQDFKNATQAATISDIEELIDTLKEKYPKKQIILLGSGFGSHIIMQFSKNQNVTKIIALSLRLNNGYKTNFSKIMALCFGFLINQKIKLKDKFIGIDTVDDQEIAKNFDINHLEKGAYLYREGWQNYLLKKRIIKNINNATNEILLFLPKQDIYTKPKKAAKLLLKLKNKNVKSIPLENQLHYWFAVNNDQNFEKFIKSI